MANYGLKQNVLVASVYMKKNTFIGVVLEQIAETGSVSKDFTDLVMSRISHSDLPNCRIKKEDNLWLAYSLNEIFEGQPLTCNYHEIGFLPASSGINVANIYEGYEKKDDNFTNLLTNYINENSLDRGIENITNEDPMKPIEPDKDELQSNILDDDESIPNEEVPDSIDESRDETEKIGNKVCYIDISCNGFFSPEEIVKMAEKENKEMLDTDPHYKEWFDYYKQQNENKVEFNQDLEKYWMESVSNLYKDKDANSNKIIAYGWNPMLEFNSVSRMVGTRRLRNLNEGSYFKTSDDIEIRLDEWKKEKGKNILFVTGLSGSGKTTLASKFARKHEATMFELDWVDHAMSDHPFLKEACSKYPEYKEFCDYYNKYYQIRTKDWKVFPKVYDFVVEKMYSDKSTLYVLEGIQLYIHKSSSFFKDKPILIKGTSMIKAYFRRYNRTKEDRGLSSAISQYFSEIGYSLDWYFRDQKLLNTLIDNLVDVCSEAPEFLTESTNNDVVINQIFNQEFINKTRR